MKIDATELERIFYECMFKAGEDTTNHVVGKATRVEVGFHPERLMQNTPTIIEMLDNLSDDFKKTGGGGMTFLNMVNDKDGNQWTGMHETADMLVCLGSAIGKVKFLLPKQMWHVLPGNMPYIVIE